MPMILAFQEAVNESAAQAPFARTLLLPGMSGNWRPRTDAVT